MAKTEKISFDKDLQAYKENGEKVNVKLLTPKPLRFVVWYRQGIEKIIEAINQLIEEEFNGKLVFYTIGEKFMTDSGRNEPMLCYPVNLFEEVKEN